MEKKIGELPENIAGALAYLLGPITGILFFLLDKREFVRFHALQSLIVFGGLFVLERVVMIVPLLGWTIGRVFDLISILLWILLMVKAYQGERYKLPYIGEMVEKQLGK